MKFKIGDQIISWRQGPLQYSVFEQEEDELRDVSYQDPTSDGQFYGVEYRDAGNWIIEGVAFDDEFSGVTAVDQIRQLKAFWTNPAVLKQPRVTTHISYQTHPGQPWKRVYGRPEVMEVDRLLDRPFYNSFQPFRLVFRRSDPRYFSEEEFSYTAAVSAEQPEIFQLNRASDTPTPLTAVSPQGLSIGEGIAKNMLIFKQPYFDTYLLALTKDLTSSEQLIIDARSRTSRFTTGLIARGYLLLGTKLSEFQLQPGGGTSFWMLEGTTVRFRHAWSEL